MPRPRRSDAPATWVWESESPGLLAPLLLWVLRAAGRPAHYAGDSIPLFPLPAAVAAVTTVTSWRPGVTPLSFGPGQAGAQDVLLVDHPPGAAVGTKAPAEAQVIAPVNAGFPFAALTYALVGDGPASDQAVVLGCPSSPTGGVVPMDLFVRGSFAGRVLSPLFGLSDLRRIAAVVAWATEWAMLPLADTLRAVATFPGVQGRQEWVGRVGGWSLYDDAATAPEPQRAALAAIAARHSDQLVTAVVADPEQAATVKAHHPTVCTLAEFPAQVRQQSRSGNPAIDAVVVTLGLDVCTRRDVHDRVLTALWEALC